MISDHVLVRIRESTPKTFSNVPLEATDVFNHEAARFDNELAKEELGPLTQAIKQNAELVLIFPAEASARIRSVELPPKDSAQYSEVMAYARDGIKLAKTTGTIDYQAIADGLVRQPFPQTGRQLEDALTEQVLDSWNKYDEKHFRDQNPQTNHQNNVHEVVAARAYAKIILAQAEADDIARRNEDPKLYGGWRSPREALIPRHLDPGQGEEESQKPRHPQSYVENIPEQWVDLPPELRKFRFRG